VPPTYRIVTDVVSALPSSVELADSNRGPPECDPATLLRPEPNPAAGMWGLRSPLLRETSLERLEEGPWGANREAVRESEEMLIAGDEQRALAFCER
jgi:hypothetical protein